MTSIPNNLTLIREDFQNPRSLSQIKASMSAAPTDFVMVVGKDDIVDVPGTLEGGVYYLATHVATGRAFRHSWPVLAYDPVLLTQMNYLGSPILPKALVPLFPETAVEPWHTVMVRAQSLGTSFTLAPGSHTIIEPWPRPERSGAYSRYRHSFDPAAVMEAVPAVLVQEINQRPFYSLREPRAEAFRVFCRGCSDDFIGSLAASNVVVEVVAGFEYDRIRASNTNYVAWFDGIAEAINSKTLIHLQVALEFPGVEAASPRLVTGFTPETYHSSEYGLIDGLETAAWAARTRDLHLVPPFKGYVNTQAILRKIA